MKQRSLFSAANWLRANTSFAKESAIPAVKAPVREWVSLAFSRIEDVIYIGLGLLLACVAATLLVAEIVLFSQYILAGSLSENIVLLLDRVLLIIIFVEILYTVQISFRQHILQPGPFLVVGLIAVTRRIIVLMAEMPKLMKENDALFQNSMIELALLTILEVALVVCLHFIHPRNPTAAAQEGAPSKK
jgi:uncharacterized membrane protein (DUF373 family)